MLTQAITAIAASGLLLAAQTASADPHDKYKKGWRGDRHYPERIHVLDRYEHSPGAYDYARVIDVDPIVHRVRVSTPRQECWNETRYERAEVRDYDNRGHRGAAGSMILGSIIGAAVGNQIGSGDGRRAATVAGAVIGSAIGHDAAERRNRRGEDRYYSEEERPYDVERCQTRYEEDYEERIDGYRVTYVYNGERYHTRLAYDPGDRIRVRVDVRPAERY